MRRCIEANGIVRSVSIIIELQNRRNLWPGQLNHNAGSEREGIYEKHRYVKCGIVY
jgi:hypothetical protein